MDSIIAKKLSTIEKCLERIESQAALQNWIQSADAKDIIVLNLVRAIQASIDLASYAIKIKKLGVYNTYSEAFEILHKNQIIDEKLLISLIKMAGFRNLAVHDYQSISDPILVHIVENNMEDFRVFTKLILKIQP